MRNLAMQAGDKDYLKWIDKYEKHPTKRMEMTLAKKLQDPKRQDLYELICEKSAMLLIHIQARIMEKDRSEDSTIQGTG